MLLNASLIVRFKVDTTEMTTLSSADDPARVKPCYGVIAVPLLAPTGQDLGTLSY